MPMNLGPAKGKDFASSLSENAVHGSDSDENALKEINFFFSSSELI